MAADKGVVKCFSGVQVILTHVNENAHEQILDSGSTAKLVKSKSMVKYIKKVKKSLVVVTNGGNKKVEHTCMVPEFGDEG